MIKFSGAKSVFDCFHIKSGQTFVIPKYQREYTWGQKEIEAFFNDIVENEKGYFIGSTIVVNVQKDDTLPAIFNVIDGQQRLTTLSILLLALYCKLLESKSEFSDAQNAEVFNLKSELIVNNDGKDIARITLQSQNNNDKDYKKLFEENGLISPVADLKDLKSCSKRRIYRSFNRFLKFIDEYLDENKEKDKKDVLFELVDKVNSALFIFIQVESSSDAYMMFESLNNRGVPLSVIDLLKNTLISTADQIGKADEYYEIWKTILGYLSDNYKIEERFLRQYYNSFRDEISSFYPTTGKTKYYFGPVATKSTILNIYTTLINDRLEYIIDDLDKKAKDYSILINKADDDNIIEELKEPLMNLERIQGAPSYILLLYLMTYKDDLKLSYDVIADIVKYLVSFFVRRNITDFPNTRNLTKIFMDIISLLNNIKNSNKCNEKEVYEIIVKNLKDNSSSDSEFEEKLSGPIYDLNPDAARFLLCYYEEKNMTNEMRTDLWSRDKNNKYVWTIEHIFPEGENIPDCWIKMIADGDKDLAKKYLEEYVHKLGNLTITGYNSNLSNKPFEEKRDLKVKEKIGDKEKEKYIGFKNGLKLNEDIAKLNEWKVDNIKTRTDDLVKTFLEEFKI